MDLADYEFRWQGLEIPEILEKSADLLSIRRALELRLRTEQKESAERAPLQLLYFLCSFRVDGTGKSDALVSSHGAELTSLTPQEVEWLQANFDACPNLDLRARLADCVVGALPRGRDTFNWVAKAVDAYGAALEQALAAPVEEGPGGHEQQAEWIDRHMAAFRMITLGKMGGRATPAFQRAAQLMDKLIAVENWTKCGPVSYASFVEFAVETGVVSAQQGAELLMKAADFAAAADLTQFVESHLALAARMYDKAKRPDVAKEARHRRAQALLDEAKALDANCIGASPVVADRYQKALAALLPFRHEEEAKHLAQERMLFHNAGFAAQMPRVEIPGAGNRLKRIHERCVEEFKKHPAASALVRLAHALALPDPAALAKEPEGLLSMIATVHLTEDGRRIGGVPLSEPDAQLLRTAIPHVQALAASVYAAVNAFANVHKLTEGQWRKLVARSTFVDPERVQSIAAALHFGLRERWELAAPVMYPQVEHHFRRQLEGKVDLIECTPDKQQLADLGRLLNAHWELLGQAIGGPEAFAWRFIAGGSYGPNRRNSVGHGLDDDRVLGNAYDWLAWWLLLRLVVAGLKPASVRARGGTASAKTAR
jgi:hypothetical protein